MQALAIFCGSRLGNKPVYEQQARFLGSILAERNIRVVFGGGSVGLMGAVADAVLEKGGPITGVITEHLNMREIGHPGVQEMIVVQSMSERRTLLLKDTDGVITLPGGYGSMDELFEALTLSQLLQYHKPIGLLNVEGYYDPLLQMLDTMVDNGFLMPESRELCISANTAPELLGKMTAFERKFTT